MLMRKLFFLAATVTAFVLPAYSQQQQRLFDQQVQLRTCNISIRANPFIATTEVEMEFYNERDQEVEALQYFHLNRGQVITDFQLELNGKYREGSIEERWKALRAYSAVVGKRIDPALLQMDWQNHYRLNIYPVPAKSSRKVKFTIEQVMKAEDQKLVYSLPLELHKLVEHFSLRIHVDQPASIPAVRQGLLEGKSFDMREGMASLQVDDTALKLDKPIEFFINRFSNLPQYCISASGGKTNFLMRFWPAADRYYASKIKTLNVYWDVSLSGRNRNLDKELEFLGKYIERNQVQTTRIFLFNHQLQGLFTLDSNRATFEQVRHYLRNYSYAGATQFGQLDFKNSTADAILLFSDGVQSYGRHFSNTGSVPVYVVNSVYRYGYYDGLKRFVGQSGGRVIDLVNYTADQAVAVTDTAENFLYRYTPAGIQLFNTFPARLGQEIFLTGTVKGAREVELVYGNSARTVKTEVYAFPEAGWCDSTVFDKLRMLRTYDSLMYQAGNHYYQWQMLVEFGLSERVVTPQTAFLVLERIEDYIQYNIAPPAELREKCAEMNYVYRPEFRIRAVREFKERDMMAQVVRMYNNRIRWWDKNETPIDLDAPVVTPVETVAATQAGTSRSSTASNSEAYMTPRSTGSDLKEVVVTSAFGIRRSARSTSTSVQVLTAEQVNTIRQSNVANALAGKVAGAQVRSQSSAKLGAESIIRLRGENGLGVGGGALYVMDGTIMPSGADINPDDVEDYTILQGPAASALFGPDGSNGAVLITTKRARKGYPYGYYTAGAYKLSRMPDVDYLVVMEEASPIDQWDTFLELEKEYGNTAGFYFAMADFFFRAGKKQKAGELMITALELGAGSQAGLKLAAYLYEKWNDYDAAIAIYQSILEEDGANLIASRDLALAYFVKGAFEKAVRTYYDIIMYPVADNPEDLLIKENALAEMNAILVMHGNKINTAYINPNLIRVTPSDLRITVHSNTRYVSNARFVEPGGTECGSGKNSTQAGGRFAGPSNSNRYSWTYNNLLYEYTIRKAVKGSYAIRVELTGWYGYTVPAFVKIIAFRNFQQKDMKLEVKLIDLENQYGDIELDDVRW